MARTTAPLLSFEAGGQIAKTQVYSKWKGRSYVRRYVIPANPNTSGQQETRNTFQFLNDLWLYMPAGAIGAWTLYADNSRITTRNGWIKQSLSNLRNQSDLANLVFSPAANGGIPASAMTLTAGSQQITVALTAPALPSGWTITTAHALAIPDQDPQSGTDFELASGTDATDPYSIVLSGLTASKLFRVGGWFEFTKANSETAYGIALQDTATPTA